MPNAPKLLLKAYDLLSFKWTHHPQQYQLLLKGMRILLILIVPTAFAIHTVTSWLFAVTTRSGWDSTIFGPYFLSGAFVTGTGAVLILMYFFRKNYRLDNYLTNDIFDKVGKLLVLVSIVYLYFNINEFLIPAYKLKEADAHHIHQLFIGDYAGLFWFAQLFGVILPIILMLFKPFRKPLPAMVIGVFVVIASWVKRFLIVVPTQTHPFLPKQGVPDAWLHYHPTLIESAVTLASFILVLIIVSILSKLFPIIPIWEMVEEDAKKNQPFHNAPNTHSGVNQN